MGDDTTDNPLEFVTTEAIVDELGRRFGVVLFVAWADMSVDTDHTPVWWRGGAAPALGLLEYAKVKLQREVCDQLDAMELGEVEDESDSDTLPDDPDSL